MAIYEQYLLPYITLIQSNKDFEQWLTNKYQVF